MCKNGVADLIVQNQKTSLNCRKHQNYKFRIMFFSLLKENNLAIGLSCFNPVLQLMLCVLSNNFMNYLMNVWLSKQL